MFRKAPTRTKKSIRADSPDSESDDEDDLETNVGGATTGDARPTKRHRSDEALDDDEATSMDPHRMDEELREEKITVFLNDPKKSVRIFLSSYMREQGLIWCVTFPVITCYDRLISYLLHRAKGGTQLNLYTSSYLVFPCFCSAKPCLAGTRVSAWLETSSRDN